MIDRVLTVDVAPPRDSRVPKGEPLKARIYPRNHPECFAQTGEGEPMVALAAPGGLSYFLNLPTMKELIARVEPEGA